MRAGFCETVKASGSWKDMRPAIKDLAPRDMVRGRCTEIGEGRGINGSDYVHLDFTHLGKKSWPKGSRTFPPL